MLEFAKETSVNHFMKCMAMMQKFPLHYLLAGNWNFDNLQMNLLLSHDKNLELLWCLFSSHLTSEYKIV